MDDAAQLAASTEVQRARALVLEYGWNSTSYQILNPGTQFWFSRSGRAVAGYTRRSGVFVAAGAPVCAWKELEAVCQEFEAFAREHGCRVCYVCAEERLCSLFADSERHVRVAVGAQPVWNPRNWPDLVQSRASIRAQLHRARNKGVVIEAIRAEDAATAVEIRGVLREWIRGRRLPPLHFLAEPNVLDGVLADRMVLAAWQGGSPVAFLVASPMRARRGYLVELLARCADAPNGTSELLIDAAMRRFAEEGCEYATLGLVALAHAADHEIRNNPRWLRGMMSFARAHANRFYNFRGLEQFRVKLSPERWDVVYAIPNEPGFTAGTLYAIGGAFSGIAPWAAIALGIARAAGEEIRTAFRPRDARAHSVTGERERRQQNDGLRGPELDAPGGGVRKSPS